MTTTIGTSPVEYVPTNEVCARAGVTYRQLDYWLRAELIPGDTAHGSGRARKFTEEDVTYIANFAKLVKAGLRHARVNAIMRNGLVQEGRVRLTEHIVLVFEDANG